MSFHNNRNSSGHSSRPQNFGSRGGGFHSQSRGNNKRNREDILINKFIKPATAQAEVKVYTPKYKFEDFKVNPLLHKNIIDKGYVNPLPIQDQAIPQGLLGKDIIGIANTGTGKTVAFAIPVLDKLINNPESLALIMCPTRELAEQILEEFKALGKNSKLRAALLIGGASMGKQLQDLRRGPRIIIGTPGRIQDHMERKSLELSACDIVVLDEVDRMLDMGFIHDMKTILATVSPTRQSFFFSATLDEKAKGLITHFSNSPALISVKSGETSDNVEQNIVKYTSLDEKIDKLHKLLVAEEKSKILIFDDTQRNVEQLSEELLDRGFKVEAMHGGRSQGQRKKALAQFKEHSINVLVATDVAARGIDVDGISLVVNYSMPHSYADYTHRIGRAGRAGKYGKALTFVKDKATSSAGSLDFQSRERSSSFSGGRSSSPSRSSSFGTRSLGEKRGSSNRNFGENSDRRNKFGDTAKRQESFFKRNKY